MAAFHLFKMKRNITTHHYMKLDVAITFAINVELKT